MIEGEMLMFARQGSVLTILLLIASVLVVGQEKRDGNTAGQAIIPPDMPEASKRRYERLLKPNFAKLELASRPLELNESSEKLTKPYKVDDKPIFRLLINNLTNEKIDLPFGDTYNHNRLVLLRDGEEVPYLKNITELVRAKDREPSYIRMRSSPLKPYGTMTEFINLADWYGKLEPGHYQLTVKHRFFWGGDWIEASPITFEVIP